MDNFESEMKDMFDGVEFQPSERVWAGVEQALGEKKKKGVFFMWQTYGVAAALILFITAGMLYKNGLFTKQPDALEGTKQLTESEEQISTDTLKNEDGAHEKLLAKEGTQEELKREKPGDQIKTLLAAKSSEGKAQETLENISLKGSSTDESVGMSSEGESDSEGLLIDLERLEAKPYRASLAATKAKWLNRLGVDESALASLVKTAEEQPEFVGENALNGRLGNNNFNISEPANGSPLAARAEDANFQAMSSIENRKEETLGSLSAGIGFSLELSQRLTLNTALRYSELRTKTTSNAYSVSKGQSFPIYLPLGYDPDNVNFIGTYDLVNTLQGLSVQPTLSYKVAQFGKFDVSVLGGVGFDYFFAYRVKGELNFLSVKKANLNDSDFIKKFNVSGITGLGLNYRLNEQFGLAADLNYRYFLPTGGGDNRRQSSVVGFGLGVNYFLQ
ncbi:hypothetical protein [Roseivirga spongicola]|uniref:Outer membrane protein beta-barrel domain-containing protein n=1 Tax=Roseivirga spongicola TaxID=333140 RepID=A0A150X5D6_9BACT|nr:hypothetical protein [Roseivirga spongicola]KYG73937.1 hypothetical protein AWW68_14825 [Roseivirga spongicola]WPZ09419.1 hypothetical protein T7867_14240 [Roseivirga spongicola]